MLYTIKRSHWCTLQTYWRDLLITSLPIDYIASSQWYFALLLWRYMNYVYSKLFRHLIHFPYSSIMRYYKCLILTLIFCCVIFQDVSGVARVTKSTDENLRDKGTYIIHFEYTITDTTMQHFAKQLIRRSSRKTKFVADIISEYHSINCLTAKLSKRALKWVRIYYLYCASLLSHCS